MQAITVHPKPTNVIRGETATFYCSITDQIGVPFWSKDGKPVATRPADLEDNTQPRRWAIFGDEASGEFNLQIVNVEDSDAGLYACNIGLSAGSSPWGSTPADHLASSPAPLHVLPHPDGNFPECLISIEGPLDLGDAVEFTCAYRNSSPEANLYWGRRNDKDFSPIDPQTHARDGFVVTQFYHSISRLDHLSRLQCIAESPALSAPRSCTTGFILVRHAPDVVVAPESPSAWRGERMNITCLIESSYPVDFNFSWTYKGQALANFGDKVSTSGFQITIADVESGDNGAAVECMASNEVGSSRATAMIEVTGLPQPSHAFGWIVPSVIVLVIIFLVVLIAIILLGGECWCRRYVRNRKLKANGWTAERFVLEAQLQPDRRGSDTTTDFFLTRTISTPDRSGPPVQRQRPQNHLNNTTYVQETAVDFANNVDPRDFRIRPDAQRRDYGSIPSERTSLQHGDGRSDRGRVLPNRRNVVNSRSAISNRELDSSNSPSRTVSPGMSDSELDFEPLDISRGPTPGQERIRQSRRSRMSRDSSGLSVQERQNILDAL
ncbi:synaptogenesis protein syg-1-like [Diadema antillarum]|uniref:synaptogenesis protein syg-1-like n=1 Tax=Diadema antillarum TaxID=105358 RepID=UPI003A8B4736